MTWELVVVCGILAGMLVALIVGGDKLDHWTFMGQEPPKHKTTICKQCGGTGRIVLK